MKWTREAEEAIKKVPFFVRKKVRARVEKEADGENKQVVTLAEVTLTRKRFLNNMASEVKGYQIDTCFGSGGTCPNRAVDGDLLLRRLESVLREADLLVFLKQTVTGKLKFHHEFRITLADCPNACSQPQIKDIGIIGASLPDRTDAPCTMCGACVATCAEEAISLDTDNEIPKIDFERCLACAKCVRACPTGTLVSGKQGFRILLGGKLGRHPRLATEIKGLFSEDEVVTIVKNCIDFYKKKSTNGKRFASVIHGEDLNEICGLNRNE